MMVIWLQHCKGEDMLGHRAWPFSVLFHLVPTISPRGRYQPSYSDFDGYLYFTGDETKAQKAHVTCQGPHLLLARYTSSSLEKCVLAERGNKQIYK